VGHERAGEAALAGVEQGATVDRGSDFEVLEVVVLKADLVDCFEGRVPFGLECRPQVSKV